MAFVESYLSKIGVQTGNAMKLVLFELLLKRYRGEYTDDVPDKLATAVVDYLFGEQSKYAEVRAFLAESRNLVDSKARELYNEPMLCQALTCAMYNYCYGKYVDSGGKVGFLVSPFIGYMRALQRVVTGGEPASLLDSFESKVGRENVAPLYNLWTLGLYKPLPQTPDSKLMMDEVVSFARSVSSTVLR